MANLLKDKKYHFIYKTTNLLNGRYYYGMHSTTNLKDGYLGSGKKLRYSIRKYGVENFKCEILEYCDDRKSLADRERELITEDTLKNPMCMNLTLGGVGGSGSRFLSKEQLSKGAKRMNEVLWSNPIWRERNYIRKSKMFKQMWKDNKLKHCDWNGRHHRDETKKKIGLANSISQKGQRNSQFGTCWITNGVENKKVKKEEINNFITSGWVTGRTMVECKM